MNDRFSSSMDETINRIVKSAFDRGYRCCVQSLRSALMAMPHITANKLIAIAEEIAEKANCE